MCVCVHPALSPDFTLVSTFHVQLQEQVLTVASTARRLEQENKVLQQRFNVLQGLLLELDGLGWALDTPDSPPDETPADDLSQPPRSAPMRSLLALQHTRLLLADFGVEISPAEQSRRPLVVWLNRPAALRTQLQKLTVESARKHYEEQVCDACLMLKLLQKNVAVTTVTQQLEDIMGRICSWLLGMLLWRPELVAELSRKDLIEGVRAASASHWQRIALEMAPDLEQCAAIIAVEKLLSPRLNQIQNSLNQLLRQHLLAQSIHAVEIEDQLLDAMTSGLRSWHGTLIVQLLFCYSSFTPVQLARAAVSSYPHFFCEGPLMEQLLQLAVRAYPPPGYAAAGFAHPAFALV